MDYNVKTTRILFSDSFGQLNICTTTGELPVEVCAVRDLPNGTPYWIIDFETEENLQRTFSDMDFFGALELDEEVLGPPHGVSLGYDEWAKLQEPGTLGL
jgi:hypothetical protein